MVMMLDCIERMIMINHINPDGLRIFDKIFRR